jgi:ribosomal protein S18 acetylase RimI-like enzyme
VDQTIALRPETDEDLSFLLQLYAGTRAKELEVVPWPREQKEAFVRQQFQLQRDHYRRHYTGASWDLILRNKQPVGRLYVHRGTSEIRVMDLLIRPEDRNLGIGSHLLRTLQQEAITTARLLSIHVERDNPALVLYQRLGFQIVDMVGGVYLRMEYSPCGRG